MKHWKMSINIVGLIYCVRSSSVQWDEFNMTPEQLSWGYSQHTPVGLESQVDFIKVYRPPNDFCLLLGLLGMVNIRLKSLHW